jgi:hypothetical protein
MQSILQIENAIMRIIEIESKKSFLLLIIQYKLHDQILHSNRITFFLFIYRI